MFKVDINSVKIISGKKIKFVILGALLTIIIGAYVTSASSNHPKVDDKDDLGVDVAALKNFGGTKVYIVEYKPGLSVDETTEMLMADYGLGETHRYYSALKGAALLVPDGMTLVKLKSDKRVSKVTKDKEVKLIPINEAKGNGKPGSTSTQPAQTIPTGLKRIGGSYEGAGVIVAVLDTGIDKYHPDLVANINITLTKDCVGDTISLTNSGDDGNGHGSHVAGTIAAVNNSIGSLGVANKVNVASVRVLNRQGKGTWAGVICGIDYVTSQKDVIKVASMSLGGTGSDTDSSLRRAINASVEAGVTYTVAAGNEYDNAANHVPAAYDAVITVSAFYNGDGTSSTDKGFPSWSNYGQDVDIAAPGVNIYSTYKNGGYNTLSGTSMATPHVAAAAALYIKTHPGATPAEVRSALIAAGENSYNGQGGTHLEPLLNIRTI